MATQGITQIASGRVRSILRDRGITQEQFARDAGISMRTLARRLHETNPTGTTLEELAAMADALQVPVQVLISRGALREARAA